MKYCVYHTKYFGYKLPNNYVGSSSVHRVECGYKGSVRSKKWKKIWEEEIKSNPHLFVTNIISYHETRISATENELEFQKRFDCIRSTNWINEGYAQPKGYAGRDVSGTNNPMYGQGELIKEWYNKNPEKVSERNRKAALTQWNSSVTRENKIKSMQGCKKIFDDPILYSDLQRKKALINKEKNSIRIEYYGNFYIGWRELQESTGVSKHLYKKYYMKGINPNERIGKNGPAPSEKKGGYRL